MQDQQKGLQSLIQEFRENNADKLMNENYQLQDRLYKLEMDEQQFQAENEGYTTMPLAGGGFLDAIGFLF